MKIPLIALSAFIGLSGCALHPEYQASLDSWVGAPVKDFFAKHREPDSMIDMIDYRIYTWSNTKVVTGSTPRDTVCTGGNCTTYGGGYYTKTSSCAWKLRVRDNVIIETEMLGESCKAKERPIPRPTT